MLIDHVSVTSLDQIEEGLKKRGLRKQLRFTYETASESLIIKFLPGVVYSLTAMEFTSDIRAKIAQLPGNSPFSIYSVGTAEFEVPGQLRKQGDSGIKPANRVLEIAWPSLMVEVGSPQSRPSLCCDAKLWLVHSAGETKIVIIITISADKTSLDFERWEMVPNVPATITRSTPPLVPVAVQAFQILKNGTVNPPGSQLVLPYLKIFDTGIPPPDAADIVFTTNDLVALGQHIFGGLR